MDVVTQAYVETRLWRAGKAESSNFDSIALNDLIITIFGISAMSSNSAIVCAYDGVVCRNDSVNTLGSRLVRFLSVLIQPPHADLAVNLGVPPGLGFLLWP